MTAEPMYRVVIRIEIEHGTGPAFEHAWTAVGDSVSHFDGNLGQWFARSANERDTYYITSDWVDEQAFQRMERSERHRKHRRIIDRFRVGGAMTAARVLRRIPPAQDPTTP